MSFRVVRGVVAAAALSAAGLAASGAGAVVFDQTFDLTQANVTATSVTSINNTGFTPTLNNASPFIVSDGDSIDYRVRFEPGQGLAFTGASGDFGLFQIGLVTSAFVAIAGNPDSTLTLFDTTGAVIRTIPVNGFTSSQPRVLGDTFGNIGVPISGTLGGLEFFNPNVSGVGQDTHFTASVVSLTATLGGFQVVSVPVPAPEPTTWALMLAGFAGLGAALRTRHRPARA